MRDVCVWFDLNFSREGPEKFGQGGASYLKNASEYQGFSITGLFCFTCPFTKGYCRLERVFGVLVHIRVCNLINSRSR